MMDVIWGGMMVLSVIYGALSGRIEQVSSAAINGAGEAVSLFLTLLGAMVFWSGIMSIAERSGMTTLLCRLLRPFMKLIFPTLRADSAAAGAISMNVAANLLGLGNAATPLGIAAMRELEKTNREKGTATHEMAMLVVINTASIQLVPTTIATMRAAAGSNAPMEIMPCVWLAGMIALAVGITTAKLARGRTNHEIR